MIQYLLTIDIDLGVHVLGIFSTEEKALEACRLCEEEHKNFYGFASEGITVSAIEVDEFTGVRGAFATKL